ncbi:MAG: hypothetical protein WB471_10935 [Nocardioides sp.]
MTNEPRGAEEIGDAIRAEVARAAQPADAYRASGPMADQQKSTVSWLDVARARREAARGQQPLSRTPPPVDHDPVGDRPAAAPQHTPKHMSIGSSASGDLPPSGVALPVDRGTDLFAASRDVIDIVNGNLPRSPGESRTPEEVATESRSSPSRPGRGVLPEAGTSLDVEFPPRLGAHRAIGALLLLDLIFTCVAAYLAYEDPRPLTLGSAGLLLTVTLVLYAVRAGSSPTHLAIRSGQLEVTRGKSLERFDLTSRYTRIEVVGKPGRPGWKVLLGRFGREPLVITSSVVDAKAFAVELERYRPRP